MIEVNVTEFRRDLKKYAEMVKKEDIIVICNGKQIMRITDPAKSKVQRIRNLRGIAGTAGDPEDILKGRLTEL